MDSKIVYILKKTPNGVITHSNQDTLSKSLLRLCSEKKTPDGKHLELCVFHSCLDSNLPERTEAKYKYLLQGLNDYAICYEDFKVYDLCHIEENKYHERLMEKSRQMNKKLQMYNHKMEITYRIHDDFMTNIDKRRLLIQKRNELEKLYGDSRIKAEDHPEYITLVQILQKAEEQYENSKNNLEKIYDLKPREISKIEFVANSTKEESSKVEKAKASLENWYNRYNKIPLSQEQKMFLQIDSQLQNLNNILEKTFETPCVYMYKAIQALDEMKSYFAKDFRVQEEVERMKQDYDLCSKKFEIYKEFIKDKNMDSIILKVENEQRQAAFDDSKVKNSEFIRKVKTKGPGLIVKLDGSLAQDESNEPKLIIGKAISGKIEDEEWRTLRN